MYFSEENQILNKKKKPSKFFAFQLRSSFVSRDHFHYEFTTQVAGLKNVVLIIQFSVEILFDQLYLFTRHVPDSNKRPEYQHLFINQLLLRSVFFLTFWQNSGESSKICFYSIFSILLCLF